MFWGWKDLGVDLIFISDAIDILEVTCFLSLEMEPRVLSMLSKLYQ